MFRILVVATSVLVAGCSISSATEPPSPPPVAAEVYAVENPIMEGGFDSPAISRVVGDGGVQYVLSGAGGSQVSEDLIHWRVKAVGPEFPEHVRELRRGRWRYRVGLDRVGIFWYAASEEPAVPNLSGTLIDVPASHTTMLGTFILDPAGDHYFMSYAEAACDDCAMELRLVRLDFVDLGGGRGDVHLLHQPRGPVQVCRPGGIAAPGTQAPSGPSADESVTLVK